MSEVITATFTNSFAHAREVQSAANPLMIRPKLLRLSMLLNWIYAALAAVGTLSIILFFLNDVPDVTYLYIILATILIIGGLYYVNTLFERAAYADFVKTDFGATNSVEIDADGFTLISTHSRWMTGWQDIKDTFRTTNTLGVVTPLMPIYIPASAFDDPDAAFAQMNAWLKAATAE